MIFRALLGGLLFVATSLGARETIPVRAGEHGDFTRVVLSLAQGTEWSLSQNSREARLKLNAGQARIDTSQLFDRIDRRRVQSLTQAAPGDEIILKMGCDCVVVGRLEPGGLLTLDVSEASIGQVNPLFPPVLPTSIRAYRFVRPAPPGIEASPSLDLPLVADAPQRQPTNSMQVPASASMATAALAEEQLLLQIARAASQGMIDPYAAQLGRDTQLAPNAAVRSDHSGSPGDVFPGIAAQTGMDRDAVLRKGPGDGFEGGLDCPSPDPLAVATWGDGRAFDQQISAARRDLTAEFDTVPVEAGLRLAKTYLHFGFGAEAGSAIALLPAEAPTRPVLLALAEFFEGASGGADGPLSDKTHCDGESALWSLLAAPSLPNREKINFDAIRRSFAALPRHLRQAFGPELGRRLAALGEITAGQEVLLSLSREGFLSTGDSALADAELALAVGDSETADEMLFDVVASGAEEAPEALLKRLEAAWEAEGTISVADIDLLAAFALEARGSKIGNQLRAGEALARAMQGDFNTALDLLDDLADRVDTGELKSRILWLLTSRSDDMTFLRSTLPDPENAGQAAAPGKRVDMARRLLDLGFPAEAAIVLRQEGRAVSDRRRLLKAGISLALDRPDQALADLIGLEGQAAERLRATALLRANRSEEAVPVLAELGAMEDAARASWLSGSEAANEIDPELSLARAARIGQELEKAAPASSNGPDLATSETLLDESERLRRQVQELFQLVREQ